MDKAEKKNDMALVLERKDSLKRKKSEKRKEIWEIQSTLETLEKKKKSNSIFYSVQYFLPYYEMQIYFLVNDRFWPEL